MRTMERIDFDYFVDDKTGPKYRFAYRGNIPQSWWYWQIRKELGPEAKIRAFRNGMICYHGDIPNVIIISEITMHRAVEVLVSLADYDYRRAKAMGAV